MPKVFDCKLPQLLTSLYSPEALHYDYLTLLNECEAAFLTIKVLNIVALHITLVVCNVSYVVRIVM